MKKPISIVVATAANGVIWKDGDMPWRKDESMKEARWLDMQNFVDTRKTVTSENLKNVLIMWKNTRNSIPKRFRPFDENINIIMSSSLEDGDLGDTKWEEVYIARDLNSCKAIVDSISGRVDKVFCMWWWEIYKLFLDEWLVDEVLMTRFANEFEWDTSFPKLDKDIWDYRKDYLKSQNWIDFLRYIKHKHNK